MPASCCPATLTLGPVLSMTSAYVAKNWWSLVFAGVRNLLQSARVLRSFLPIVKCSNESHIFEGN